MSNQNARAAATAAARSTASFRSPAAACIAAAAIAAAFQTHAAGSPSSSRPRGDGMQRFDEIWDRSFDVHQIAAEDKIKWGAKRLDALPPAVLVHSDGAGDCERG